METNFEHYKDELLKVYICGSRCDFITENVLNPKKIDCGNLACSNCLPMVKEWLDAPYEEPKEPEIDWAKVPPDTRVIVSQTPINNLLPGNKHKRYFAKYDPKGNTKYPFLCYTDGATSWSEEDDLFGWQYCELADPADIEKYSK